MNVSSPLPDLSATTPRAVVLPLPGDFLESSFDLACGAEVVELHALPDDAIDLMQVVREVEGRAP
jgi:hypothetical protein